MPKLKNTKLLIGVLATVALAVLFVWYKPVPPTADEVLPEGGGEKTVEKTVLDAQVSARPKPIIPSGKQTYQIMQAEDKWPKIVEATIDPPDVHVGDTQKLLVTIETHSEIVSVEARIETDNGTVVLPLVLVAPVTKSELVPRRYAVLKNGRVVLSGDPLILEERVRKSGVAFAEEELKTLKYSGEWIVRDTHDAVYHTTFVAKDTTGNENSVTIAWSDACAISSTGAWNITSNAGPCTISSLDGVENGTVTIQTYTLTLNAPFTWNPGQSIIISSGAIVIGSSGYLTQAYLFYTDFDGDTRAPNTTLSTSTASGVSQKIRRGSAVATNDCNDNNGTIWQLGSYYLDSDGDGYGAGTLQSPCSGVGAPPGYSINNTDCLDSNANVQINVGSLSSDNDQDGWTDTSAASRCVWAGGTTAVGGRTYYRDTVAAYTWLVDSQKLGTSDCLDTNINVQVNKTTYADSDGDQWVTTGASQCTSNSTGATVGCSTNYSLNSSSVCVLTSGLNGADCQDTGAGAVNVQINRTTYTDADADNWVSATTGSACLNVGTGGCSVNYALNAASGCTLVSGLSGQDCQDSGANASVVQNLWPTMGDDTDQDRRYTGALQVVCLSNGTVNTYWHMDSGSNSWIDNVNALGTSDCNDGSAGVWTTGYGVDNDGDNYGQSGSSGCNNGAAPLTATAGTDCYDSNASAKPGQTSFFTSVRGDSSYDYNCDSVETKFDSISGNGSCANTGAGYCTYNVTGNCSPAGSPPINNQTEADATCQNKIGGWRTDYTATSECSPFPVVIGGGMPACGQCSGKWIGPFADTTACNACDFWGPYVQGCR